MTQRPAVRLALLAALFFSGLAALVYEVVWVRLLGELFGHTVYAVHVVLAVFFGGLAAGSAASDRLTWSTGRLLRAFAAIECLVATAGVVCPGLIELATPWYDRLAPFELETGAALGARLAVATVLLLPPTALMGATFPLVVRFAQGARSTTSSVPVLYAANTLGGALGAWLCAFVALPRLGLQGTLLAAAAGNLLSATLAWHAARAHVQAAAREPLPTEAPTPPALKRRAVAARSKGATGDRALPFGTLAALLFGTGLVALALEVLWARALDQVLSGTVYSFATVLAVFLAGIALGSLALGRREAPRSRIQTFVVVESVLAVSVTASLLLLGHVLPLSDRLGAWLGLGFVRRGVVLESLLAGLVLLPPTLCLGLAFPLLLGEARARIGTLVAANTLGSVAGPLLAGFGLLPWLGVRGGLIACTLATLGLALLAARRAVPRARMAAPLAGALACLALLAAAPRDVGVWARPGEQLVDRREDPAATVTVVESPGAEGRRLKVNNTYSQGGGRGVFTERRQGHLPMFFHGQPEQVLVLGLGTGNTLGAVSLHGPRELVAVELVPGVVELARRHFGPSNYDVLAGSRARVIVADARRVVRATRARWDLVVADLFHPWQAGVGSLYSREHFAAVRRSLRDGGVFCQWLPLYQLGGEELRVVVRTFLDAFPHVSAWLGNFGAATPILALFGSDAEVRLRWARWEAALVLPELAPALEAVYLDRAAELVGGYVGGREALARFAGAGPVNRVDRPRVEFAAPSRLFTGSLNASKREALSALIEIAAEATAVPLDASGARHAPAPDVLGAHRASVRALVAAQIAMETGDTTGALELAVRATRLSRDYDVPARVTAQLAARVQREQPDLAISAFEQVLRVAPDDPGVWGSLGAAQLSRARLDDAERAFRRALEAQPGWPAAEQGLAEIAQRRRQLGAPTSPRPAVPAP